MSTEHQQYSIANQSDANAKYAEDHGMRIVRTYSDAGKSGVTIQRRDGLLTLIADVEGGSADYAVVLVYDISRWGRFQDVDESAYYEYLCKRNKIAVLYCAEPFANDGSTISALLKAIKRTMAGEYSRELSAKVSAGKRRLVEAGFRGGGSPGYGLRRLLVDQHGNPKGILKRGENKSIMTDRTLQILGPPEEVAIAREIFRLYVQERRTAQWISRHLNARGIASECGGPWTRIMIVNIVTNPKYIGANVTRRTVYKLGKVEVRNPPDKWLIRPNTFEPIIDVDTFRQAQPLAATRYRHYTNEELLEHLKRLLHRTGKLSAPIIQSDPKMPGSWLYADRFGSLFEAYRLVGYDHGRPLPTLELARTLRGYRRQLVKTIESELTKEGAVVRVDLASGLVKINDEFTLRVAVVPCEERPVGTRWIFRLKSKMKTDLTVMARMDPANDHAQDYYVFPRAERTQDTIAVTPEDHLRAGLYRFDDLSFLKRLARRANVEEST